MRDPATIYQWLAEVDSSSNHDIIFRNYAEEAKAALRANRLADAWPAIHSLKLFSEASRDPFLFFESRLIMAIAAFMANRFEQSRELINEAIKSIGGFQPHTAIARWMEGCALLQLADGYLNGLICWQDCLNGFHLLALSPCLQSAEWYETRRSLLSKALENELRRGRPSSKGVGISPQPPTPGQKPGGWPVTPPVAPEKKREPQLPARNITLSTGFDEIPAGPPTQLGNQNESNDSLEIEQFVINNEPYTIHVPGGSGKSPRIQFGGFVILRVTGDSMNQAGIQDGDYVLLRRQEDAEHSDIVAVEITGQDYEATLKRFLKFDNGKHVVLKPESDNPAHKERHFIIGSSAEAKYRIRGVVAAVLKKA